MLFAAGLVLALASVGCGEKYPKCKSNLDCADYKEFCVQGFCKKCSEDAHCNAKSPCQQCNTTSYTCELQRNCCVSDSDCPYGKCTKLANQRAGKCASGPCTTNAQCGRNQECKDGICVATTKTPCTQDSECGPNAKCRQGFCEKNDSQSEICELKVVHFDFDEHTLSTAAKKTLDENGRCLKLRKGAFTVEGNTDQRGTAEYNLALGQRRANAAQNYLVDYGISGKRMKTVSYGKEKLVCERANEACYKQNRRVELRFR